VLLLLLISLTVLQCSCLAASYAATAALQPCAALYSAAHRSFGIYAPPPPSLHTSLAAVRRVLGALPWLPFASAAERWSLAASALAVVRGALTAGSAAAPLLAGPKAAGPPCGLLITPLAADVAQRMATAGECGGSVQGLLCGCYK
jgi:hypothetical protein